MTKKHMDQSSLLRHQLEGGKTTLLGLLVEALGRICTVGRKATVRNKVAKANKAALQLPVGAIALQMKHCFLARNKENNTTWRLALDQS